MDLRIKKIIHWVHRSAFLASLTTPYDESSQSSKSLVNNWKVTLAKTYHVGLVFGIQFSRNMFITFWSQIINPNVVVFCYIVSFQFFDIRQKLLSVRERERELLLEEEENRRRACKKVGEKTLSLVIFGQFMLWCWANIIIYILCP